MIETTTRVWTLTEDRGESLGLSCAEDGLFLGRTPLLECQGGRFVPRPENDLERILNRGFGIGAAPCLDRVMPGFRAVSSALNENNLCRARIAAIHLQIPELPNEFARLAMETEDLLIKVEAQSNHYGRGGEWDPSEHPRTGTAPNPGWFAPKDGADGTDGATQEARANDKPVKLDPGVYVDELADFAEWIANAKPEDEQPIRKEIKRLYYDVGDIQGGNALNAALSAALEPGIDQQGRQEILDWAAHYARADPAEVAQFGRDLTTGALLLPPIGAIEPEIVAGESAATVAEDVWKLGWATRGKRLHEIYGADPEMENFETIDAFPDGVATSIKSVDLRGATYQDTQRLFGRISRLIDDVASFQGGEYDEIRIKPSEITSRMLKLVIPKGDLTAAQEAAIGAANDYANSRGVKLLILQH